MRDLHNVEILKGHYIRYVGGPRIGELHFMRTTTKSGLLGWAGTAPLDLENDNGIVPAYVVPQETGSPATLVRCTELYAKAMSGEIHPFDLNGAAWVALNKLMDHSMPNTEQLIAFLTGTYTLSELNGTGAVHFRLTTAAMFGLTVANKMEAERFRKGV